MKIRILTLVFTLFAIPALASQTPRPLGSDFRIRQVPYSPNEVYEVKATYGYQTTIEFSSDETVQVASIGDSIAWQVMPVGNRLFLKPVEQNPQTNLTVITTKRTYYFRLSTVTAARSSDVTYLVRFEYPKPASLSFENIKSRTLPEVNYSYRLKNDKKSGLMKAYDDGQFTYLRFRKTSDLPAIFMVDSDNKESLVNYRVDDPYVIIERVADKFVFRRGGIVGELINKAGPSSKKREDSYE